MNSHIKVELPNKNTTGMKLFVADAYIEYIHVDYDCPDDFFLIGFKVINTSDSGAFHALEHLLMSSTLRSFNHTESVLSLSKKMKVSYLNGFTSSDTVFFAFASSCTDTFKEFYGYILEAVFSPEFKKSDFQREVFKESIDNSRNYTPGVIINEMRATMASPSRVLWEYIKSYCYQGSSYGYNAGGDVDSLTQLSIDQLEKLYKSFFTQENCTILTLGKSEKSEHEGKLLPYFEGMSRKNHKLNSKASAYTYFYNNIVQRHQEFYSPILKKNSFSVIWKLNVIKSFRESLEFEFLITLLRTTRNCPLSSILSYLPGSETMVGVNGFEMNIIPPCYVVSVETDSNDISPENSKDCIYRNLVKVVDKGFSAEDCQLALDRMSMKYGDIHTSNLPYGIDMLSRLFRSRIQYNNLSEAFNSHELIEELRIKNLDSSYATSLVSKYFIDNDDIFTIISKPRDRAIKESRRIRQEKNIEMINKPRMLESVKPVLEIKRQRQIKSQITAVPVFSYFEREKLYVSNQSIGNIGHFFEFKRLNTFNFDLASILPFYSSLLTELSTKTKSKEECQRWQKLTCSIFSGSTNVFDLNESGHLEIELQLYSKLLARNASSFFDMASNYLSGVLYENSESISNEYRRLFSSRLRALRLNGAGFVLAQSEAAFSHAACMKAEITGFESFKKLNAWMDDVKNNSFDSITSKLVAISDYFENTRTDRLLICDPSFEKTFTKEMGQLPNDEYQAHHKAAIESPYTLGARSQYWNINSSISSSAVSYKCHRGGDISSVLHLVADIISSEYLYPRLRASNGVYYTNAAFNEAYNTLSLFCNRSSDIERDTYILLAALDWYLNDFKDEDKFNEYRIKHSYEKNTMLRVPENQLAQFVRQNRQYTNAHRGSTIYKLTGIGLHASKEYLQSCIDFTGVSCSVASNEKPVALCNYLEMSVKNSCYFD